MPDIPSLKDDPCGRADALRAQRDKLITGGGVAEMDTEAGNGVRRRVRFSAADLARLDAEIRSAENACAIKSGKRPRNYAVTPSGGGW